MIATSFSPVLALTDHVKFATPLKGWRSVTTRLSIKDMIVAMLIVLSASAIVYADERLQDWIPDVLAIPEDAEVVTDRAIGSTVRMLSLSTGADVEALFAEWEESLNSNGYPITQEDGELLERSIEFSGPGIANAKIILAPTTDEGRNIIEFDATLN
jgi:hypothetical protein